MSMKDIYSPLEIDEQWDQRAPSLEDHFAETESSSMPAGAEVGGGVAVAEQPEGADAQAKIDDETATAMTNVLVGKDSEVASDLPVTPVVESAQTTPGATFTPEASTPETPVATSPNVSSMVTELNGSGTTPEPLAEQSAPAPITAFQPLPEQQQGQQDEDEKLIVSGEDVAETDEATEDTSASKTAQSSKEPGMDMYVAAQLGDTRSGNTAPTESELASASESASGVVREADVDSTAVEESASEKEEPEQTDVVESNETKDPKNFKAVLEKAQADAAQAEAEVARRNAEAAGDLKEALGDLDVEIAQSEREVRIAEKNIINLQALRAQMEDEIKKLDPSYQPSGLPGLSDPTNRFSQPEPTDASQQDEKPLRDAGIGDGHFLDHRA